MWFTIVGAVLNILNVVGAVMMFAVAPVMAILFIVAWLCMCFCAKLFIDFIKNDTLETRQGVVTAFKVQFVTAIA